MIKKLKTREESDNYLTHICRHLCSGDSLEKKIKCQELSSNTGQCCLKVPHISSFLRAISATKMSKDMSQVGVALFLPF